MIVSAWCDDEVVIWTNLFVPAAAGLRARQVKTVASGSQG